MNSPVQLQDLIATVAHRHPSAQLEFDPLPSGVCFLWVTVAERNFVLEYNPKEGAGVSENFPDTPLFVGHDHAYESLDPAVQHFLKILAEAEQAERTAPLVLHDKKA
jgi:hypothetical protein